MKTLLFTLALFVALAGPGHATSTAARGVTAHRPVLSDSQIERNIRAKLLKSKINADHFTVSVQGGVATLEGKTGVIQHKGVATRLAKTGGALGVANHIQISPEARAKAAARLAKYRGTDGQLARATVVAPRK